MSSDFFLKKGMATFLIDYQMFACAPCEIYLVTVGTRLKVKKTKMLVLRESMMITLVWLKLKRLFMHTLASLFREKFLLLP